MNDKAQDLAAAEIIPPIRVPAAWTMGGLIAGLALGILLSANPEAAAVQPVLKKIGELWLRGLQATIAPLVVSLLIVGVHQTVAAANAGVLARRTLLTILVLLGLAGAMSALVTPLLLEQFPIPARAAEALLNAQATNAPVPSLLDFLDSLVPANVLAAASSDAMLPLILFTAVFALATTRLAPPLRQAMFDFFAAMTGAMMVIVGWVLKAAPLGVFAMAYAVAAKSGVGAVAVLAHYILLVVTVGSLVLFAAYAVAVFGARLSFTHFARSVLPAQSLALSTQSSLACLPAMVTATRELGARSTTAELVLPLAVALFRATSPAINFAVVIYIAKLTGVAITPTMLIIGFGVTLLTSLGAVSLPGSISFISVIAPICLATGVPIAPLGLLVAVEMFPDLMRTLGNVTMDIAVTAAIDRRTP